MTQSQTQTPQKENTFAALDKKVADGIAADKVATQPQPAMQTPAQTPVPAPQQQQQAEAKPQAQQGDMPATKS
ncbi:MAG: hypothetical protein OJJ21_12110 [Ferrovibrio sp.]|uniref:hypothetical protein n=1 Tax=Ferrovibrio sp. TaxID=1917215 RepID=UPI00262F3BC7|nr:hypothetical protein [Ferrovibrio sp.]MCW0234334.1 hypothetical protein [Ferrovibrio sp.]